MAKIDESLTIKNVTLKNRVGMSPMCQYSSVNGFANDWHLVHYGARAVGGVGLVFVEATAVAPEGRITPYDLGLWSDTQVVGLQKIVNFVHQHGAAAGIQLAHAGRKASHDAPKNGGKQLLPEEGGWQAVGPSPVAFDPAEKAPDELSKDEILYISGLFRDAALRALEAGFDIVEIHAAHGYLMHEFLSPLSNLRTDEYGGSFENRIRFLTETVDAVKTVWPGNQPLFVRLSCSDWTEGGWDIDQTVELCRVLLEKGVDVIDCSSGGNVPSAKIPVGPAYQVPFSEAIKKTGIRTAAVGMITSPEQISGILGAEKSDLVLLGRELLRNPYFMLRTDGTEWPVQYLRSK